MNGSTALGAIHRMTDRQILDATTGRYRHMTAEEEAAHVAALRRAEERRRASETNLRNRLSIPGGQHPPTTGGTMTTSKRTGTTRTTRKAKAAPKRRVTTKATAAPKRTRADVLADLITAKFGGKAKLSDLAASPDVKRAFTNQGDYFYRTLSGVITQDKGRTLTRVAPGVVGVVKAKKAAR